jgi:hypothetical protein
MQAELIAERYVPDAMFRNGSLERRWMDFGGPAKAPILALPTLIKMKRAAGRPTTSPMSRHWRKSNACGNRMSDEELYAHPGWLEDAETLALRFRAGSGKV